MQLRKVSPASFMSRLLFAAALALAPFAALANNVVQAHTNTKVINDTDAPPAIADNAVSSLVLNSAMLAKADPAINADNAVTSTLAVCTINVARATETVAANLKGGDVPDTGQTIAAINDTRLSKITVTAANATNNVTNAGFAANVGSNTTGTNADATGPNVDTLNATSTGASTNSTTFAADLKGAVQELVGAV